MQQSQGRLAYPLVEPGQKKKGQKGMKGVGGKTAHFPAQKPGTAAGKGNQIEDEYIHNL